MSTLKPFTKYEKFLIAILSFLQFTIILDFMILSPLGAMLIPALKITPGQFGLVVSAYAFSAGASGLLAAGFADRFDRKKLLLFFYTGFVVGTLFCGLAPNYNLLLIARMVTGVFGGVLGSVSFAIITDVFPLEQRGRVMGFVQTSFAASQVLGIPIGLFVSNHWGWHAPFIMIVAISVVVGAFIFMYLRPVNAHLKMHPDRNPLHHLMHTLSKPRYWQGFAATALLMTGGFMLMPFSSAFSVHNLGIDLEHLPLVYMASGLCSIIMGPIIGRYSDVIGKFRMFVIGSSLTIAVVIYYTHMGLSPLGLVIAVSVLMFTGVSSRMISSSALISGIPQLEDRGSYMAVSSSIQQISGGIAAAIAGLIVFENADGSLGNFDILGYAVAGSALVTIVMMYFINVYVQSQTAPPPIKIAS